MKHIYSMHLKFGYFVLYTTRYRLTERKSRFHLQKLSMRNVRCETSYVLGLLVHGKVVGEFGRKVFPVNCILWKTLNMAKLSISERAQAFYAHENSKCTYSRKHNCDEISKWRHSRGSSNSYPCQSRYDVGTGLRIMSRG